jgi:hypothetical protein
MKECMLLLVDQGKFELLQHDSESDKRKALRRERNAECSVN